MTLFSRPKELQISKKDWCIGDGGLISVSDFIYAIIVVYVNPANLDVDKLV